MELRTQIVGSQYHEGARAAILELARGEELALLREKDNRFDKNAVAVLDVCGQKLGYIPRQDAPSVARILDTGLAVTARCRVKGTTSISIEWEKLI